MLWLLIGGAVVVENVFARVGLGTALVNAILSRDYPVIQACILLLGITVVLVEHNLGEVLRIADRLVVLDAGKVLAEGVPADVMARADVRQAYTGVV